MGYCEAKVTCVMHQDLKQLQGVCASCVREKLADLYMPSQINRRSQLSPPPSLGSSSPSPPGYRHHHHKRVGSDIMGPKPYIVSSCSGLKKSKSITFGGGEGKKKGFWSKLLLRSKGNKRGGSRALFEHNKTTMLY